MTLVQVCIQSVYKFQIIEGHKYLEFGKGKKTICHIVKPEVKSGGRVALSWKQIYLTAHFSWQYLDDCQLPGINHLSEITFPAPDTPTLTIFASSLMSDRVMVRPHPSRILIRLSSLGDSHLLAGTGPQRCQPQSDILWWLGRWFWEQIDGNQSLLYVSTRLPAMTHDLCTHIKVRHEDDAGLGLPFQHKDELNWMGAQLCLIWGQGGVTGGQNSKLVRRQSFCGV